MKIKLLTDKPGYGGRGAILECEELRARRWVEEGLAELVGAKKGKKDDPSEKKSDSGEAKK